MSFYRNNNDEGPVLPPRVKAAFNFLHLARMVTEQCDAAIPMRDLSPLEKSVETAALKVLQQYLLGEMEFVDEPSTSALKNNKGDDDKSTGEPCHTT